MVRYIESGNIFKLAGITNYAHGCNCAGAMGKGIAIQFKTMYPKMYEQYRALCKQGLFKLGDVYEYNHGGGYVFNLGTQKTWRTNAQLHAIEQSLKSMLDIATTLRINKIALPRIGAGLGGLKWEDVKSTIDSVAINHPNIELIVVENFNE